MLECDCLLCGALEERGGRTLLTNGLAVAADAAPLAPGHLLLHTLEHAPSFSVLTAGRLAAAERFLRAAASRNEAAGRRTLFFEHGTTGDSEASGCVDHAHIHVLPIAKLPSGEPRELLPQNLVRPHVRLEFADLRHLTGSGYFWLADEALRPQTFVPEDPRRQVMRQVVASILGRREFQTWDLYDVEAAKRTTETLAREFAQR